jgi:anti-sigma B factor antagonist
MVIATSTLSLDGEVDAATADDLRMRIVNAPADIAIVLDAADLTFIDCAGLNVLIEAKATLQAEHRRLSIVNRPRVLTRILDATGLTEHFD